ncbi:unnamed protein product, partial [Ectocarpus sp. 12 AP-2014]
SNLRDTYHRGGIRWNPAQARSQASSFCNEKNKKMSCIKRYTKQTLYVCSTAPSGRHRQGRPTTACTAPRQEATI